jgi:hypothetical protein
MKPMLQRKRGPGLPRGNVRGTWLWLPVLVTFMLSVWLWVRVPSLPPVAMAQQTDLSQLPLSFPVQSPEVAAYFQEIARPQDIASFPPERLFLLSQDTVGQKMVAYRSWADAQTQLDDLTGPVDMVMYNPENWELTPEEEQQDLAATVQEFAEFVHERGLRFMFAPDRRYAELYLSQVAPDVDAVLLQGQRLQHDPQTFATWVRGMTEVAHAANPDMRVFVQVGATRGTASEMLAALQTVADDVDGIAVWSMPRTLHVLQEFVTLLRGSLPDAAVTPSAATTVAPSMPLPTESPTALPPTATPPGAPATSQDLVLSPTAQSVASPAVGTSPSPVPLPSATPSAPAGSGAASMSWVTDILLFAGGAGLGLVMGFVLGWRLRRGP